MMRAPLVHRDELLAAIVTQTRLLMSSWVAGLLELVGDFVDIGPPAASCQLSHHQFRNPADNISENNPNSDPSHEDMAVRRGGATANPSEFTFSPLPAAR
jgi:hypothetical protein